MNDSYKKRLYTQVLSLSAAVLMAILAQGKAAADQQNSTESQPAANQIEAVNPATEAAQAVPNQTGEKNRLLILQRTIQLSLQQLKQKQLLLKKARPSWPTALSICPSLQRSRKPSKDRLLRRVS